MTKLVLNKLCQSASFIFQLNRAHRSQLDQENQVTETEKISRRKRSNMIYFCESSRDNILSQLRMLLCGVSSILIIPFIDGLFNQEVRSCLVFNH